MLNTAQSIYLTSIITTPMMLVTIIVLAMITTERLVPAGTHLI
jgi:hypothetical protein